MLRINGQNNSPEVYDRLFNHFLAATDMERHELLAKYFKGGKYLDVGCFDSLMPILLSERFPKSEIWALDYAPDLIDFLTPRFKKVHYLLADASKKLPFDNESLDYVVAGEVIEHLEEPAEFVKESLRILKPGGYLAISTPWEEKVKQDSIGGPYHVWSYSIDDIKELLGTEEVTTIKEERVTTILAWRQKTNPKEKT
jgi:ubiquinone/menaquinone biosynthesis C-methylase UbiE